MIKPCNKTSRLTNNSPSILEQWLILAHVPGMYSRMFNALLDQFQENPAAILSADYPLLMNAGIGEPLARAISQAGSGQLADTVQRRVDSCLISHELGQYAIVTRDAQDYPALLRGTVDPPPILYIKGNVDSLHLPMVAMVGSRRPSADGRRHAWRFARQFAEGGLGVLSGLALGIDTECHRGALDGQGQTVAVLGCGIDRVYPASNRSLADQIAGQGALITEFNPGTPPLAMHFPRRNRIISGLSLGVVVVEAGLKSGTLITARCALEQGREVYAIPGSINNPMARGCHSLINQGSRLIESPCDVVEDNAALLAHFRQQTQDQRNASDTAADYSKLSRQARQIIERIGFDPVPAERLLQEMPNDAAAITAALVELEIQGLITKSAGGYVRQKAD